MLKTIDPVFTPELLRLLAQMGHSDELAIVDMNYPAYSAGCPVVHIDSLNSTEFLTKLTDLFPIDTFDPTPIRHMQDPKTPDALNDVQTEFVDTASTIEERQITSAPIERRAFYSRAQHAHLIVVTAEPRPYGCFLLSKGVIAVDGLVATPDVAAQHV